jgi:hypothetical protein
MRRKQQLALLAILSVFFMACSDKKDAVNYYFDPVNGDDKNPGTRPGKPFKSLGVIKKLSLGPGDSVLLKAGSVFYEHLYISCKGAPGKPVVLGRYGGTDRPYIKGDASRVQAVHVYNSEHFIIRDIEISNTAAKPVKKIQGLLVELHNYGKAKDITIDNVYVHDVKAVLENDEIGEGGAIVMSNYRDNGTDSVSSHFDGLLVQNCLVEDCGFGGIAMWGNWERKRWDPSLGVVIRNNIIDGISGHGIVPVACESPLVEYNVMKNSPQLANDVDGVDGIWPWSCDNAVVQYNVVSDIKSQWDAYGFDADYNCTNSLFQYNLSYNNKGGFLLVCNSGGWSKDWSAGNVGSVIRYNVSINDGLRDYIGKNSKGYFSPVIHCTGSIKNSVIEKNLIYIPKKKKPQTDKTVLHLNNWGKNNFPDSTFFRNNFIFAEEPNLAVNIENSTNHFFENNQYVGELKTPAAGFAPYEGQFGRSMWFDSTDGNWHKLVSFLKDKTVPLDGRDVPVLTILGYH